MKMEIINIHNLMASIANYDFPQDTLFIMCGLPGSGKSTLAKRISGVNKDIKVFSSDEYREKFYGDANVQANPAFIFETLRKDALAWLKEGKTAIIDATNIKHRDREAYAEIKKECGCYTVGVVVMTPDYVCKRRNKLRDRVVPDEVIDRMTANFTVPYEPYFDELYLINN